MARVKTDALGETGEKIVRNHLASKGFIITDTIDVYDSTKDFDVEKNGKKYSVEVKTQVPFVLKNSFSVPQRQSFKIKSVDMVIFVLVPPDRPFKHAGKMFVLNPRKVEMIPYTTKKGVEMILIPIEQSGVKFLRDLTSQEISLLQKQKSTSY